MSTVNWPAILTLVLVLAKVKLYVANGDASFQPIFQTEETVRRLKAQEMQANINASIDPCVDFYEHACGNAASRQTQSHSSKDSSEAQLVRLLDEPVQGEDSALARQGKEFYKSCVSAQAHQSQQQQLFLSEFIQQNGGFPAVPGANWHVHHHNYNWVQVLGQLRRHYGLDILIGLRIGYNYGNLHENSIYLAEPSMRLPAKLCSATKRTRGGEYEPIAEDIAEQLKAWLALGNDESQRVAADILSLEHELCGAIQQPQLWQANLQLYQRNHTRKTLAELTQLYGQGQLDFDEYVSVSFGQTFVKPVYMSSPAYYRQLLRTVGAYNMSQVANYIMYRALDELTFPLNEQLQSRPAYCMHQIKRYLPMALGELYARQHAHDDDQRQLQVMYAQLQAALQLSLHADWLEEGTRRAGERKLRGLTLTLPRYERPKAYNLQLERSNYWHNLRQLLGQLQAQTIGRLYEDSPLQPSDPLQAYERRVRLQPLQRCIELGWALLQPPAYDVRYGQALSYASLGPLLAQQLVAAFDDMHWSVALLEGDSWDALTALRYRNRSNCFAQQVADYLRPNASAVQQLISNSAALNIAFRAYITWLGFLEPHNDFTQLSKETLPGLNYSNTALFFVAYAQQHCGLQQDQRKEGKDYQRNYSVRQRHSWTRLMVNGPLRNMAEFAREFRCQPGTPMNPADKCVIY